MNEIDAPVAEPRAIHELLERMAEVLSAPDPHRVGIQEIIARYDAR